MEAILLWLSENVLMLVIATIEAVGLSVWKQKDPDRWKKIKKKKAEKYEKLGDINMKQVKFYYEKAAQLKRELNENGKNA